MNIILTVQAFINPFRTLLHVISVDGARDASAPPSLVLKFSLRTKSTRLAANNFSAAYALSQIAALFTFLAISILVFSFEVPFRTWNWYSGDTLVTAWT